MAQLDREHFVVLHLNGKNRIIARETVSIGSLNQAIIHPREVFKAAVHNGSAAIICVHNHPSGDPAPSSEDRAITCRLREAGDIIGIKVLDHIVIGQSDYVSFLEHGLLHGNGEETYKKEPSPTEQFLTHIGRTIHDFRKLAKMTQNALSVATGINQSYLSQIERGLREIKEAEARSLAEAFKQFSVDHRIFLLGADWAEQSAPQGA